MRFCFLSNNRNMSFMLCACTAPISSSMSFPIRKKKKMPGAKVEPDDFFLNLARFSAKISSAASKQKPINIVRRFLSFRRGLETRKWPYKYRFRLDYLCIEKTISVLFGKEAYKGVLFLEIMNVVINIFLELHHSSQLDNNKN